MRECDRQAIRKLKIPGLILMENAGRGVADAMAEHLGSLAGRSVLVLCGKGNNGGDGFVVSRHLLAKGASVTTGVLGDNVKGDAHKNLVLLQALGKSGIPGLNLVKIRSAATLRKLGNFDIIVDALFGTGFKGPVRGFSRKVIDWVNSSGSKVVAVDIPSGVNSDDGTVENVAVKADLTVTMGFRKIGLTVGQGRALSGITEVIDIGIPDELGLGIPTHLVIRDDVKKILPHRQFNAHKHSVGRIIVIAGSRGLTGAAAMAAGSAMRVGAGAVILKTPASVYPILARKLTEVMVEPMPETPYGTIAEEAFSSLNLEWADVIVVGPGLSRNPDTARLIRRILSAPRPLVVDADALSSVSDAVGKKFDAIITPHTGELSRMTGITSREIDKNRVDIARRVAKRLGITVVLKGAPTVVASERGEVFINSTGNPGMATAGAGDVLAGCIAGLWAQHTGRTEAAYGGVFVHGLAGDIGRDKYGEKGLLATDIEKLLPQALSLCENS